MLMLHLFLIPTSSGAT